jgi:integration host factor subunit beta
MEKKESNVTKAELAEKLSAVGISQRHARQIVDFFFEQISETLRQGKVIHLVGFGAFRYKTRPVRVGRNPRTGERVDVPAKRIIQFRPGRELKLQIRKTALKGAH